MQLKNDKETMQGRAVKDFDMVKLIQHILI